MSNPVKFGHFDEFRFPVNVNVNIDVCINVNKDRDGAEADPAILIWGGFGNIAKI